jgi:hypothetical protein
MADGRVGEVRQLRVVVTADDDDQAVRRVDHLHPR